MLGPGSIVGDRFLIVREAGTGGSGVVFEAKDRRDGSTVALKIVKTARLDDEDRFEREVVALSDLRHPAIVRYIAHGTLESRGRWLAMEWVEGGTLADRLERGAIGLQGTLRLGVRVAEALAEAHARGIVHRDITPRNLLLPGGSVEDVKVVDFGIARVGWTVGHVTRTGVVLGTPGYMSPEQARGSGPVDPRADLFALGCVLHECLTGVPLFRGDHILAVLAKLILEDAPRVRQRVPELPVTLDDLIARMLEKDAALRPATATEVAQVLDAIRTMDPDVFAGAPPPVIPALGEREQRLLSVVVARVPAGHDEVGPTVRALAGVDDPALAPVARLAEQYDGRLELLANGSLVASLQGRGSATDLAARAARLVLALRSVLPGWSFSLSTGRGDATGRWPVGPAVDRAVALRARASEIALDDVTSDLLDARFEVTTGGGVALLVGEHDTAAEPGERTLLGKPVPCVGRDRELGLLADLFHEAVTEPCARAILVTGAAGVGKTRLRRELLRRIGSRAEVLAARGDAVRPGAPFGLLAPALRRAAGVREGEPLEARRAQMLVRVRRHVSEPDALRIAELLGEIAGVPFPDDDRPALRAARHDPIVMGDQMRLAFEDWLAQQCAVKPVLLVLDDLQWGDLASVRFVDGALRNLRDTPLVVLALARPEVRDVFPRLWEGRALQEVSVGALGRRACAELARTALGPNVPEERLATIVQRSEGNPLLLEELVRAEADGEGDRAPETVVAMLQARLEALPSDVRRVLRAASILGREFWRGALEALLGSDAGKGEIDHALGVLVDREVVVRRAMSRFAGDQELAFRHDLLREAAYGMLTSADRTLGHRLAGSFLEHAGEASPSVLAEHFERGQVLERAAEYYLAAARKALEANDFATVLARAESGVQCGATGETLGLLRLVQSEAHRWRAESTDVEIFGLAAMETLAPGSAPWFDAAANVATAAGRTGDAARLESLTATLRQQQPLAGARRAAAIALSRVAVALHMTGRRADGEELLVSVESSLEGPDPEVRARAAVSRSYARLASGDLYAALLAATEAAASFDEVGDVRGASNMRANRGHLLAVLGDAAAAERELRDALAGSRRLGVQVVTVLALVTLGSVLARAGRTREARAALQEALDQPGVQDDLRLSGSAQVELALCAFVDGDHEAAARIASTAVETAAAKSPTIRAQALALLARIRLAAGDAQGALADAEEAVELVQRQGGAEGTEPEIRLVHVEALAAAGRKSEAAQVLEDAKSRLREKAAQIADEPLRRAYLAKNAGTLDLQIGAPVGD